jgi:hypothetical protein
VVRSQNAHLDQTLVVSAPIIQDNQTSGSSLRNNQVSQYFGKTLSTLDDLLTTIVGRPKKTMKERKRRKPLALGRIIRIVASRVIQY